MHERPHGQGRTRLATLVCLVLVGTAIAACGGSTDTLVVYSGRNRELVGPLLERFHTETGIRIQVRYGDSTALANALVEEGDRTQAEVFFSQDAGTLGIVDAAGMLTALPDTALDRVPAEFRADDGGWVGTSGRARVVAFNTDSVPAGEVPSSVFDLTAPRWQGKVAIAPRNASFQAFVSAMTLEEGEEATRQWLEGMVANDVQSYPNNLTIVEAVARNEVELGLVNNYYLHTVRREQGEVPVENHFLTKGDPGALVNASGVGVVAEGKASEDALRFVEFLLSDASQEYFVEETGEYALVSGISPPEDSPPLADVTGEQPDLSALGAELPDTVALLESVGLL
ncbi:MAG: iron ABC transporter substrate-binding protein [Acidimicrobiia bacterium]|nr:iron ABC transporter substrate-binding protein [Acidimicrobiia bacterium]